MYEDYRDKILSFYHSKHRMPTYSEMMELLGFKSKQSVARLVEKMVDAGVVTKDSSGRILPTQIFDEIPMLGLVKAGLPSPAEEILTEMVSLDNLLIDKKESTYILEVDGDSMIDAHIADGDLVLVELANKAKDGQIVIAEVDGEWTMKYFRTSASEVWLEPANKNYKPIYPEESIRVAAIVKAVVRRY